MLVGILMNHLQQNCDLEEQGVLSSNLVAELDLQVGWIASQPGFKFLLAGLGLEALAFSSRACHSRTDQSGDRRSRRRCSGLGLSTGG